MKILIVAALLMMSVNPFALYVAQTVVVPPIVLALNAVEVLGEEENEPITSKLWTLPLLPCAEPQPAGEQSEAPGASLPRLAARKKRSQP